MTKKIVVTGIGATSPIGGTAADSWSALLNGQSGARTLDNDWAEKYQIPVNFAAPALVPGVEALERTEAKRLDHQLRDFQRGHGHLAIVVDEFGGTPTECA